MLADVIHDLIGAPDLQGPNAGHLGGYGSEIPDPARPVPSWRNADVAAADSGGGVSARKLAATLWEMNEVPSPRVREGFEEEEKKKKKKKKREMMMMWRVWRESGGQVGAFGFPSSAFV